MVDWWSSMAAFQKAFWYFAIPFTVLFSIQTGLTFLGMGDSGGLGGDDESGIEASGSFPIFTIRNFIIFFMIFGWTGIATTTSGFGNIVSLILAVILGLIVMFIVAGIFYFMSKMTENGNMNFYNAIGKMGDVYLSVPEKRTGVGKVQIKVQGALREIEALTDGERIPTGSNIIVTEIVDGKFLLVEKIDDEDFYI